MQPLRIGIPIVGFLWAAAVGVSAATNTATLQLFCTSVRVEKGQAKPFGQMFFEMEFSSYFNWWNPNGEFYNLFSGSAPTHRSGLYLTDATTPGLPGTEGGMEVTVPEDLDANEDGLPDFYQVRQGINVQLGGGSFVLFNPEAPEQPFDSGTVTARWVRGPGQHRGQCTFTLLGTFVITSPLDFVHPFEILEYRGPYSYIPTNHPTVPGRVELTQTGNGARTLNGPMAVEKPPTNPLGELVILDSIWTNAQGQDVAMLGGALDLDSRYEMEYWGGLTLSDGDLTTRDEPDYEVYFAAVDDPNDYDGDSVPDLNDPAPLKRPVLKVTRSPLSGVPVLQIRGSAGQSLDVQFTATLSPASWSSVLPEPVTLNQDEQSLELPAPSGSGGFYRSLLLNP